MPARHGDWLEQARWDLEHGREAARDGHFDWACFAAHQAAEMACKALHLFLGSAGWGHDLTQLLSDLPQTHIVPAALLERAKVLDKHYIPARYPNGFASGTPHGHYTRGDADSAIQASEAIVDFCRQSISR
jgi:HEPN domain-containing protein